MEVEDEEKEPASKCMSAGLKLRRPFTAMHYKFFVSLPISLFQFHASRRGYCPSGMAAKKPGSGKRGRGRPRKNASRTEEFDDEPAENPFVVEVGPEPAKRVGTRSRAVPSRYTGGADVEEMEVDVEADVDVGNVLIAPKVTIPATAPDTATPAPATPVAVREDSVSREPVETPIPISVSGTVHESPCQKKRDAVTEKAVRTLLGADGKDSVFVRVNRSG